ncbi:MAG: hypothetical protein V1835_04235 [Candidatus Micrarchaeota archaeon]
MWKIIAVFLLLLVLVGISAFNKEGLSWMLTIFFAFLGVGVFIYAVTMLNKMKKSTTDIKTIKNAMGSAEFNKHDQETPEKIEINIPIVTQPEHAMAVAEKNELHAPMVEMPKIEDAGNSNPAEETEELTAIDLAKLRAKIKKDDDDEKPDA